MLIKPLLVAVSEAPRTSPPSPAWTQPRPGGVSCFPGVSRHMLHQDTGSSAAAANEGHLCMKTHINKLGFIETVEEISQISLGDKKDSTHKKVKILKFKLLHQRHFKTRLNLKK